MNYLLKKVYNFFRSYYEIIVIVLFLIFVANLLKGQMIHSALYFDGVDDYVDCGNDASLQITDEITIEAWARYDDVSDLWSRIVTKGRWLNRNYGWMLHYSDEGIGNRTGLIFVIEVDGDDRSVSIPNTEIEEGVWYHFAASFDGEFLRLYVDGVEKNFSYFPGTIIETGGPYNVQIGRSHHWEENLHGAVDEVRIWNKALEQQEIQYWKNRIVNNSHPNWSDLRGYWRFDDENDPTDDYSDYNNLGYLHGPIFINSDVPLPVELSSFCVNFVNSIAAVSWNTQSESNNLGWNIFRGEDKYAMQNDEVIQINPNLIDGAGTTSQPTEYSFDDYYYLIHGTTYYYWIECIDTSGDTELFGPVTLAIPNHGTNPKNPFSGEEYGLIRNFPNPFDTSVFGSHAATNISFKLKEKAVVKLTIHNIKGELIKTLLNEIVPADTMIDVSWNGRDENNRSVSSGVYFLKMRSSKNIQTKKMMIIM